jgi:hypothetical protein
MALAVITTPGEIHKWPAVHLFAGVEYTAFALGLSTGRTLPDPEIAVTDSLGNPVAYADDTLALGDDPYVTFRAPYEGDYNLWVADVSGGIGEYRADLVVYQGDVSFGSDPGTYGPGSYSPDFGFIPPPPEVFPEVFIA